jgi:hypothetical protein
MTFEILWSVKLTPNVHSFAVGGAILLRRPWRLVLNVVTKDKILFKSLIDKCQLVQMLNRITGDDRRFASPPAAAKLNVACWPSLSISLCRSNVILINLKCSLLKKV